MKYCADVLCCMGADLTASGSVQSCAQHVCPCAPNHATEACRKHCKYCADMLCCIRGDWLANTSVVSCTRHMCMHDQHLAALLTSRSTAPSRRGSRPATKSVCTSSTSCTCVTDNRQSVCEGQS